jgi:hypothetical protein
MREKNKEILQETLDEIEASLKDSKGIVSHQSRLAFSLSAGAVALLENYFEKFDILKSGAKINHLWFKKSKENVKKILLNQVTSSIEEVPKIDEILNYIFDIEKERNELAYGKRVSEEHLKGKISIFLKLKELSEK